MENESDRSRGSGKSKTALSEDDEELPPKPSLKERNPWVTVTEFCASDETEEEEEKLIYLHGFRPVGGDVRRRDSRHEMHGCQSGVTANAGNHLHPRHKPI